MGKCASGRCDTAYLQPTFSVISERIAILKASQAKKGWMKMKKTWFVLLLMLAVAVALPALAQTTAVDVNGKT